MRSPLLTTHPSLRDAVPAVYWLDRPEAAARRAPLDPGSGAPIEADLVVVGGGYTGLWSALEALERNPQLRVLVLEGGRVGSGASGRNGGFMDASLTHGLPNGLAHFPAEIDRLMELGRDNLDGIFAAAARHGIEADLRRPGQLLVATEAWQEDALREGFAQLGEHGERATWLEREELAAYLHSPQFLSGYLHHDTVGLCDPAQLVWGLAEAVERLGGVIHDDTFVTGLRRGRQGVEVRTGRASVQARKVVVATNAFPGLLPAIRRRVAPVWDYVLMTEPLSAAQWASIGWDRREGLSDAGNQFHYVRPTDDGRILWGGYDALYYYGGQIGPQVEHRAATYDVLANHFFAAFPQLDGLRFSHCWGGPIATTSRFCVTFGTALGGDVSFAVGYTGLGVAASRFGARVALALVDPLAAGDDRALADLRFVRRAPVPFPPEPLRWPVIQLTRRAIARADADQGRRGPWLKLLDAFGVGFDS